MVVEELDDTGITNHSRTKNNIGYHPDNLAKDPTKTDLPGGAVLLAVPPK
jgi:hypothetical protein